MSELKKYLNHLKNRNYSPHTLRNYSIAIQQYQHKFTTHSLQKHFKNLLLKLQANTCLTKYRALLSYSKYQKAKINWTRIKSLLPKIEHKFFTTLNKEELERLKTTRTEANEWTHERNNLILDFLFYTGIRVNELVQIKHSDYQNQQLRIKGKGNKFRYVFLPPFLTKYLNPYSPNYLFTNQKGDKLTDNRVYYIVKEKMEQSGIKKKITPHSFRRSFATLLHNRKAHLTTIQMLLGHESINTTERYIQPDFDYLYQDYSKIWKPTNPSPNII